MATTGEYVVMKDEYFLSLRVKYRRTEILVTKNRKINPNPPALLAHENTMSEGNESSIFKVFCVNHIAITTTMAKHD